MTPEAVDLVNSLLKFVALLLGLLLPFLKKPHGQTILKELFGLFVI
jgi:hypothetical protein